MVKKIITFAMVICMMTIVISLPTGCTQPTPEPSAARDLTETWTGSGVYYQLDLDGNRVLKVTCNIIMTLQQTDSQVRGTLDVYPTKQEPTGQGDWVPEVEGHSTVNGKAVITTLTFYVGSEVAGTKEKWEFTFTSDLMSGHVTNLDTTFYAGRDSDPDAFKLVGGGSQSTPQPSASQSPTHKATLVLPSGTPPKPPSMLASNAEYYLIYTVFNSWFGEGQFSTTYEKYSNNAVINQWAWFWIGSEEDESKRIYFDRLGDQWKPKFMSKPLTSTPTTPPPSPSAVQIWEIVDETGHTATLTVDSNGNFTGSGWVGSTPSGTYDIPITNGVMSGTSMSFCASASYDSGQGTILGTGSGTLNEPFPLATRDFSIKWTATRKSD